MKITLSIPDTLVSEVKEYAQGNNLSESLVKALSEWVSKQKIRKLNKAIKKRPLEFIDGFSAKKVRKINRGG